MNAPFEVRIASAATAYGIGRTWCTRMVSLVSDGLLPKLGPHHLIIGMDDVEDDSLPAAPARAQIEQLLDWSADLKPEDRLLLNCMAGQRRSPAAAIAILIQHGMSVPDAISHCRALRPIMVPNLLILRHADDILGLRGDLTRAGEAFVQGLMIGSASSSGRAPRG